MSFFITILSIGFVVFIHELGHLIAAKRARVGVTEFAIGMGPKIVSVNIKETMYSLRLLPIGGFIKAKGLDDLEDCSIEEDYRQKSILARASIIVAGSFMNILLGMAIFTVFGMIYGNPTIQNVIDRVLVDTPAYESGFQSGDKIIQINQTLVKNVEEDFIKTVQNSKGAPLSIIFERDDQILLIETQAIISPDSGGYVIGVSFDIITNPLNIIQSFNYGVSQTILTISQSFLGIKMLVTGEANINDLAGPVGIVQFASSQFGSGIHSFFRFIAFISISLGVINLFPLPVLDGGHLLFLGIEAIRKKPLNKNVELVVYNTTAIALILLMCFTVVNDITKWNDRVEILKELNE